MASARLEFDASSFGFNSSQLVVARLVACLRRSLLVFVCFGKRGRLLAKS